MDKRRKWLKKKLPNINIFNIKFKSCLMAAFEHQETNELSGYFLLLLLTLKTARAVVSEIQWCPSYCFLVLKIIFFLARGSKIFFCSISIILFLTKLCFVKCAEPILSIHKSRVEYIRINFIPTV